QNDHCHTQGGTDRQFANHPDVDQQQRHETYGIGSQRHHAGHEQLAERQACRDQRVVGFARRHGDAVDFLYAMGNADGEDQERYQHRIGIETKTQGVQQAELPDHGDQRRHHHRHGALHTASEPQQQCQRDADGDEEEQRDAHQPIDQITHLLGEADDMDLHVGVLRLVLVADFLFQLVGELLIVEGDLLTAILRVRVGLHQRYIDDARLEVVGDQSTDLPRLENVVAQVVEAFFRTVVRLGDHLAPGEALFGHLGPANAWAP